LAVDPGEQSTEASHLIFNQSVHRIEKKCPDPRLLTNFIRFGDEPIE
jgi:hypothetical protein